MGRKHKIPIKIVVPTKPMVEEPPKINHTAEAFYLDHLRSQCARAETPTSWERCGGREKGYGGHK
jgi:hypothetical protein